MPDRPIPDQPDLREEAFLEELGLARGTYRESVNNSVDHALGAPSDPLGWPATHFRKQHRDLLQRQG